MSSSRSRPSKKDLNEYKKLSGKDAKGRLSWDTQALKNKLDQLRGSTTATTYNITNNNYYSKTPQTAKKPQITGKKDGRLGSTAKVKEVIYNIMEKYFTLNYFSLFTAISVLINFIL